jgi:hypothetical protein
VSILLGLLWWIVVPISMGIVAAFVALSRGGIVVWFATLIVCLIGIFANSAIQTFSICGLSLEEMRADLSRNCMYASNPIGETFGASVVFTSFISLSIFFISTVVYAMTREKNV